MDLSQKRVNRVKDYLVSKGIDKKRITGKGYGGSKPVASNETEDQRMLNRRVEFMIKKL
jgi:outer membrane protein OmpA-like peptidoglycan-associated protein